MPRDPKRAKAAPGIVGNALTAYALAGVALAAAILLRLALDPWLGNTVPFITLFGAVAAAVWLGGRYPAIVVAILGYVTGNYLFMEPRWRLGFDFGNLVALAAFVFTCSLIIGFGEAMRRAQVRANERRELLRVTLYSIGDAVVTTDVNGRVASMNGVAESLTGWTQTEALRQPLEQVFRIVNEDTRQPVENPAIKALREGTVVGLANHTVLLRKDGGECPIDDSAAPITDEHGLVSGCVLIFRDVTEQRRLQRERASQLHTARVLASIVESSDDAIISKSLDGVIQSWNAAAERLFGHTAEHAIGRHISLIIPPERIAEEDEIISSLKAGKPIEHYETERLRSDGRRIFVSLTISPINDEAGQVVGASKIVRDVTDRKLAEAERQKFVTLVETSTDFIGMSDLEGMPFYVNRAGLEMVGLKNLDEARRTPVASFFYPEDQQRVMNEFFPAVRESGHGEIDIRFRHFQTGEARWMAYKVLTLPDESGKPIGYATVSQDVTERRQLEDNLRKLADDLSEADRRKNEFVAMLAHELRNPLAPISNAARALRLGARDEQAVRAAAELLERQVGQMSRLVDDLLDMSRITRGRIELRRDRVELAPIVDQAVEAVRAQYPSMNHELSVTMPTQPVYLHADPARLSQVIANLLNNACKFTDRGGRISLRIDTDQEDGHVVVRVRDNGIGIPPEHLPRLFEMFAQVDTSLERSRDGLGIGLTLVKTLVELHGGTVSAHSEGVGRGSEFAIRLPVAAAVAGTDRQSGGRHDDVDVTPRADRRRQSRRRRVAGDALEFGGHQTHIAHDGKQAIEAADRLRPDAVLLDIGLPRMNGYEVCRHIRSEPWGKGVMIIALTGWGQDEDRQRSTEAGFDAHLVKPVDHEVLLRLLDSVPGQGQPAGLPA